MEQVEPLSGFVNRFRLEPERLTDEGCYIVEMRNLEEDPDCSVARARVEPCVRTKLHCLRGTVERYVILEGIGEVEIGEEPPVSVSPFDVVNIPTGVPQRIRNIGSKDLIFLCVRTPRFRPDAYEKLED
jgi:mannose-6-phosphate isomerase-like protein (cupin superfamily)